MRRLTTVAAAAALCLAALAPQAWAGDMTKVAETRAELMARGQAIKENAEGHSEAERLEQFIDLYFEYTMNEHPEFATMIGHPTGHDRWTDNSLEAEARRDEETVVALDIFKTIDREQLQGEDRLNHDLIMDSLVDSVEAQKFKGEYLAINQMGGVHQNAARMLAMMPAVNRQAYENILSRLSGVPYLIDNAMARLEKGLAAGVTPPKVTLRDVPQQVKNQIVDDPAQSPLLRAFQRFPADISEEEQTALRERANALYTEDIRPAFEKLHGYLVDTYVPGARESIAMKDLPDGEEWYAFRVKQMTTTDLSPEEIHSIGQSEVERIRGLMDGVIADSGFEGTFEEFTEFLRTDPQFYFETAEELLAAYRDIAKRADGQMPRQFGLLPRTPYEVTPVPAYAEKSQTTAYYQPGSLDAGRAGQFFANTYKLNTRPKWEMEALTLHEAVPGHHHQIALSMEMEDQPWFRRFGGYTAYTEGWGLYSESLGEDMGFYQDPYSKFGQLTYEIWRAIRLVVDTGMHQLGWSRQDAIDFFIQNTGKQEHDIVVEVDRYIVWPGQALAYKIGELKLKELRALAKGELGDDFDVRAFHDTVLGNGALPLRVLETQVREWIAAEKGETPEVAQPAAKGR
ncbi:MAG: DUF885 family protein [Thermoanaerobaculia bacterium]